MKPIHGPWQLESHWVRDDHIVLNNLGKEKVKERKKKKYFIWIRFDRLNEVLKSQLIINTRKLFFLKQKNLKLTINYHYFLNSC